jgi:hypothetical protein
VILPNYCGKVSGKVKFLYFCRDCADIKVATASFAALSLIKYFLGLNRLLHLHFGSCDKSVTEIKMLLCEILFFVL